MSRSNWSVPSTGRAKALSPARPWPALLRRPAKQRRRPEPSVRGMQAFLEYVVKGLVQHADQVSITPVERNGTTVYEMRLNPEDVGRIIGKQGVTINAIRSLLTAGSARKGLRCSLEIVEDQPVS